VNSYDVRFWQIETRKGKTVTYRVRWVVAGRQFSDSFTTKELAESHRAKLRAAARRGEGFGTETGLPESMVRTLRDVSFYEHCAEFAAATWPVSSAKTRLSVIETLTRVVPVVVSGHKGAPDPAVLRSALRKTLNQGGHAGELDEDEARAIAWIARASRPVGSLADPAVVCDVLDALTVNLDGKPAAPEYFSRRRRVMHRALAYAIRKKRLTANPLSKANLPEGWTPPQAPDGHPRPAVGGQSRAHRGDAGNLQGHRQEAGQAVHRVLRLHVLRHDAPVRGRGADPQRVRAARAGMGSPDVRRRQSRRGQGVHRRRAGARAPGPQRKDQGTPGHPGAQARTQGPDPAGAGGPAARAPRPVRDRHGRPAVPQRER